MGNREWGNGGAIFRQSLLDFPCPVTLGKDKPYFGLHRFNKGLRFIPPDDEGFTLRGDRQRLLYKGRQRSHRFTILGDTAFEYDCILNREPESNVISLRMEGAENFDFFRQPDFVREPFLKGSYAVYKKETLIGEGTGKLCHIHRPEIIDARGRRCWGYLAVVGNELRITIPEKWLSEAEYPVVVDPTIGTATIGSQTTGPDPNNSSYDRPWLDGEYALNKYLVPQNGNGLCTAYVYCYNTDTDSYVTPLLYTNENNKPYMKKSQNENDIDVSVWPPAWPVGWRNNTFKLNGNITAGEYVWFGVYNGYFTTRFDYSGECYKGWFNYDLYEEYDGEPPPHIHIDKWQTYCTIKWSWYFSYTAVTSQNYVRTITQGVTLNDTKKLTGNYKRSLTQTAGVNSLLARYTILFLKIQEIAKGLDSGNSSVLFIRSVTETAKNTDLLKHIAAYTRRLSSTAGIEGKTKSGRSYSAVITDTVHAAGSVFRGLLLFVRITTGVFVRDYILGRFLKAREELVLKSAICREIILESKI